MNNLFKKDGNWRQFCYTFLIENTLEILLKLKLEYGILGNLIECDKSVLHFISDLINHRFTAAKNQSKVQRNHFLKIYFDNKGIEMVNLQSILHKVKETTPASFTDRSPPAVLFTRTPRIGFKIFNYKNVVKNLRAK